MELSRSYCDLYLFTYGILFGIVFFFLNYYYYYLFFIFTGVILLKKTRMYELRLTQCKGVAYLSHVNRIFLTDISTCLSR